MMIELGFILTRAYIFIGCILLLNAVSVFIFEDEARFKILLKSIAFIPFWPLAIFSAKGRSMLLNRMEKL